VSGVASPLECEIAVRVCTSRQLDAWRLRDRGLSLRAIALAVGSSVSTVRSQLWEADRKIALELGKETA
jgi:DNA-binding NarL/FixJ family response regulator